MRCFSCDRIKSGSLVFYDVLGLPVCAECEKGTRPKKKLSWSVLIMIFSIAISLLSTFWVFFKWGETKGYQKGIEDTRRVVTSMVERSIAQAEGK